MRSRMATVSMLVALAAMLAIGSPSWAQAPGAKMEFGVKAGANFSDINTDQLTASKRAGLVGGVYVDLATVLLHLQGEALISQHGFKGGTPLGSYVGTNQLEYRDTSLQLPVLFMFVLPTPVVSPRAYIGPALSIPLKSELKLDNDWVDVKKDIRTTWNLVFGVGAKFFRVGVDLRYSVGLNELNDRPVGEILNDAFSEITGVDQYQDIKDHTLSFTVSVALN